MISAKQEEQKSGGFIIKKYPDGGVFIITR